MRQGDGSTVLTIISLLQDNRTVPLCFFHNMAYSLNYEQNRTAHVDLDNNDEKKYSQILPF